ncbi:dihydrofolate reductase family protein [Leifsonia kafniensis]|uniref:Dihydrofolate reductase family protein n=1 Tax=Leifsonia kafniensis TaxID=475957 RepID=A0ABP7KCY2_9MICO
MAKLIYSVILSLDGYIADQTGKFDWAAPSEEVHAFVNDLERPVGTYLYGRRMYEVMLFWETAHTLPEVPPAVQDFTRIWQATDKIVFSTTLDSASSVRTRIERRFDPAMIRELKQTSERDIGIGGPTLAAHAITAGLVDEYQLFVVPILIGGGTRAFPDENRQPLDLVSERRFASGVVYLNYRVTA